MVNQRQVPPGGGAVGDMFERMTGWPSPEKVLSEMQRLNNNMEVIQPDLHKLAQAMDGLNRADIQNLTAVLGQVKMGDTMRVLNEFSALIRLVYEKLWGKLSK